MKQLDPIAKRKFTYEHGGSLLVGRRRKRRPISVNQPLHLVLRSDFAFGRRNLTRHRPRIHRITKRSAERFRIRIYEMAVVSNHIHILAKGKTRPEIQNFFRVVAGHIAQEILVSFPILEHERPRAGGALNSNTGGAPGEERKGPEKLREKENKFWQTRIYSKIVEWGRQFRNTKKYVMQNTLEALGIIQYSERKKGTKVQWENSS